jgi:tRNA A37 threonylcarbamoyltransferase TsaD
MSLQGKLAFVNVRECLLDLPYSVKGMDISFSGLLTATIKLLKPGEYRLEDLCYSLQEVAFSMLTEVTERALAHTEKREVLLTGGVGANKRLQAMLSTVAEEHSSRFCVVPKQFALDNGAMIAWTGILSYQSGVTTPLDRSYVRLKWRLEDVNALWVER